MATRQSTPGSPTLVLAPTNSLKRAHSEDADSDTAPDHKKMKKSENASQLKDKKKRKKKKKKTPVVVPLELPFTTHNADITPPTPTHNVTSTKGKRKAASAPQPLPPPVEEEAEVEVEAGAEAEVIPSEEAPIAESPSPIIARLERELTSQSSVLKKHKAILAQFQQSITCQVCLDLLHKPYALAPCGHIACYNCLVSWFTSKPDEPHYGGMRKKKTCPHCRASINERPVEVWNIKDMVASLLKSGLVSGLSESAPPPPAVPGPPQPADAPADPWHNIFRYTHQHPRFQPLAANGEPPSVEDMGMFDAEDGGVYRCLDCMHEIWEGVCSSCHRVYPGHQVDNDFTEGMFDEDSDEDEGFAWAALGQFPPPGFIVPRLANRWWADDDGDDDDIDTGSEGHHDREEGYDSFIDDDDDDGGPNIIDIADSDTERGSTPPWPTRARAPVRRNVVVVSDSESEDNAVAAAVRPPRRRTRTLVSSPIVVSDDDTPRRHVPARVHYSPTSPHGSPSPPSPGSLRGGSPSLSQLARMSSPPPFDFDHDDFRDSDDDIPDIHRDGDDDDEGYGDRGRMGGRSPQSPQFSEPEFDYEY